jgi:phospholipid/cholesterol/gamma-HCH transport system substrate-binding protein
MEQQTFSLQYKVGLFIGAGLIAVMAAILLLGGEEMFFARYIYLRARFQEVQGLFPGSIVSLAGVPVGNVSSIQFVLEENKLDVVLKIKHNFQNRLYVGTTAEIRTQGALGDKYVFLNPGAPGKKVLGTDSVLPGIENDYFKLLTDREDGVARIVDLIKEMHILIASINQNGRSGQMMRDMATSLTKFSSTLTQIDGLVGDLRGQIPENGKLRAALIHLSDIMAKIDQGKGTLGQLINDPSVYQNLKAYLGGSARNRYMKDMIRETIQKSEIEQEAK